MVKHGKAHGIAALPGWVLDVAGGLRCPSALRAPKNGTRDVGFCSLLRRQTRQQTRPGSVRLEAINKSSFQVFAHVPVCFLGMLSGAEFVSWPKHRYEQYPSKAWFSSHI